MPFVITSPLGEVRETVHHDDEVVAIGLALTMSANSRQDRELRVQPHGRPLFTAHPDGHVHQHLKGESRMFWCPNSGPCDVPGCDEEMAGVLAGS